MFLSEKDLYYLSGYKQPASQIRWLQSVKLKYLPDKDGKPKVLQRAVDEMLRGAQNTRDNEPNFQALMKNG